MDEIRKQKERVVVEYFLGKLDDAPRGRLVASESPDFILSTSRKYAIGIELTEIIFDGENKASAEDLKTRVLEAIAKKRDKLGLYRKRRLDKYWLVITTDGQEGKELEKMAKDIRRGNSPDRFHRVFLLDLFAGKLYDLK